MGTGCGTAKVKAAGESAEETEFGDIHKMPSIKKGGSNSCVA